MGASEEHLSSQLCQDHFIKKWWRTITAAVVEALTMRGMWGCGLLSRSSEKGGGGKERREVGCCKQSSRSWSVAKGNSWGCQKWKKLLRTEESREETTRLKGSFCEPCTPVCKSCLWCGLQHKNVFEQFILMILLGEDQRDIPTRNSLGKKKRQHEEWPAFAGQFEGLSSEVNLPCRRVQKDI